jgi:2-methylisocitrate lyase-like PEP mutase family enzyme
MLVRDCKIPRQERSMKSHDSLVASAESLRALHVPGDPVVLPNAWDAASARVLAEAGFAALATSSGAVARALGYEDGHKTPPDEMFGAIARITRAVDLPVTADIERGYDLEPKEIVERLVDAGAVGCNLEDSDPLSKELIDLDEQAEWLRDIRSAASDAAVPIVVNARVDVHLRKWGDEGSRLETAVERGMRYLEAGADCVYPIFLNDPAEVKSFVDGVRGNVNVVFLPGSTRAGLASTGVARISLGSGLHDASMQWLKGAAAKLAAGDDPYKG